MRFFLLSSDADQNRWQFRLLIFLLLACLLLGGIWLYYDYRVQQLDQQLHQLHNSSSIRATS